MAGHRLRLLALAALLGAAAGRPAGAEGPAGGAAADGPAAAKRAYVAALAPGTETEEREAALAAQVMLASLAKQRPSADLVLIVPAGDHFLDTDFGAAAKRGVKVLRKPRPLEATDATAGFRLARESYALHAWGLAEYERVVLLGPHLLVLRNPDELFRCGSFCAAPGSDPCAYGTEVLVLKPGAKVFQALVEKGNAALARAPLPTTGLAAGVIFPAVPPELLVAAPLFRPKQQAARTGIFRLGYEYRYEAARFNDGGRFRDACLTEAIVVFGGSPWARPYYWWAWPLSPLALYWHEQRRVAVGFERELVQATAAFTLPVMLTVAVVWLKQRSKAAGAAAPRPWARKGAPVAILLCAFGLPAFAIPATVHPVIGYALFFEISGAVIYASQSVLHVPDVIYLPWLTALFCAFLLLLPAFKSNAAKVGWLALASALSGAAVTQTLVRPGLLFAAAAPTPRKRPASKMAEKPGDAV